MSWALAWQIRPVFARKAAAMTNKTSLRASVLIKANGREASLAFSAALRASPIDPPNEPSLEREFCFAFPPFYMQKAA